jgi:t-SNARE complex subunit (syntaxin)
MKRRGTDSETSDDEEMQQQHGLLGQRRNIANERSAGMNRIHQQVSQVSAMFRDLSTIVISQGESVATIEQTVDKTAGNIKDVNIQLKVTGDRKKQLRDIIVILAFIVLFVLGISIYRRSAPSTS